MNLSMGSYVVYVNDICAYILLELICSVPVGILLKVGQMSYKALHCPDSINML